MYVSVRSFVFGFLQIAPVYLSSCEKQGLGLLELLFYRQPVQDNQLLIKVSSTYILYCFL